MTEGDKHPHPSDGCGGTRLTETGSYSPEDPALPVCRRGPWFPGPLVLLESPDDTQTDEDDEETSANAELIRFSSYSPPTEGAIWPHAAPLEFFRNKSVINDGRF